MIRNLNKTAIAPPNANYLLMLAYKQVNPIEQSESGRCRFDMFVRLAPGNESQYKNQQRTWCYRGDKYTPEPHKMLRNLISLANRKIMLFDRIILYDNDKALEDRVIVKIIDGCLEVNHINQYSLMLLNYPLPEFLK